MPDIDPDAEKKEAALQVLQQAGGESGELGFQNIEDVVDELEPVSEADGINEQAQRLLFVGQRWAGPGHWKFKAAPAAAASSGEGGRKARGAKRDFTIDFTKRKEAGKAKPRPTPHEAQGSG